VILLSKPTSNIAIKCGIVIFANDVSSIRNAMENDKRMVVFDLDGTLINSLGDLSAAVDHAMAGKGFPGHTEEEYQLMVGNGVRKLVQRSLPQELQRDEALVEECLFDFKEYYSAHIDIKTRPYPGMPEILSWLQGEGIAIAVASNKFQSGTEKLLAGLFPDIRFAAILGDRPGHPLKPDHAIVKEAMDAASAGSAVYVGDSVTDMQTAANSGLPAVAVTWGYRSREELLAFRPSPDAVVDDAQGLKEALQRLLWER